VLSPPSLRIPNCSRAGTSTGRVATFSVGVNFDTNLCPDRDCRRQSPHFCPVSKLASAGRASNRARGKSVYKVSSFMRRRFQIGGVNMMLQLQPKVGAFRFPVCIPLRACCGPGLLRLDLSCGAPLDTRTTLVRTEGRGSGHVAEGM
jgi:hypothetical protein